jgi:acyl transferase domain-containing protein/thioesterase domain-containing protein
VELDFESSPFYVNASLATWEPNGFPRRAGVNSLGVGGTNAFVILEEPPAPAPASTAGRPGQLLVLSARSESALDAATLNLARHLRQHPDVGLADVAWTLQVGRKAFAHRRIVACHDLDDAVRVLEQPDTKRVVTHARSQADPSVVFMFPGGGAQYPNMARELYEAEPRYREVVDRCLELARPYVEGDLKRLMLPSPDSDLEVVAGELERPSMALPALFITEYALAKLWMAWGIRPAAMTGHSMGEYTAACLAGAMSEQDALSLVALRGALFETLPEGAMLGVRCCEARLRPLLGDELDLAAVNGPELCLASGPVVAIDRLAARLAAQEIEYNRVKISVAAHSRMLEPILGQFARRVGELRLRTPTMRWMSNLTGTWITPEEATDPSYWVRHLRLPVRFSDGIQTLLAEPNRLFLEVGPGQTLASLVKTHLSARAAQSAVVTSTRHPRDAVSDVQFILTSLGRLWLAGVDPEWSALHQGERRRRIELPTYPFERQRYWIDPGTPLAETPTPADPLAKVPCLDDWFYRPAWKRADTISPATGQPLCWLVFRDRHGLADEVVRRLGEDGHRAISVSAGEAFARLNDAAYVLSPDQPADYDALMADLVQRRMVPQRIVHLWSVAAGATGRDGLHAFETGQSLGFKSLLFLAQALGSQAVDEPLHIGVVSNQLQSVEGEPILRPERATLLGPCKVIPREFAGITCQSIDVMLPDGGAADSAASMDVLAAQIIAEVAHAADETVVAYRGHGRWIETFEAAGLDAPIDGDTGLREGGVYLITGGLGGIGLVQASYLARAARAKLVLVGRTGLPDRQDWPTWLASHASGDATSRRIRQVQALEGMGAEVLVASADVTDIEQMRAVVEEARARFGPLTGVIHAAGVLHDGVIQLKACETAEQVIAPKVKGALVLDALLKGHPLDFFILFSSTSSILGPTGQVDYVGANAFLNTFAQSKTHQGAPKTVAIDWGVWQDVGMAARAAGVETDDDLGLPVGVVVDHPLLGVKIVDTPEDVMFRARYATDGLWMLGEHRLQGSQPIVPGTGYLEIARAALTCDGANRSVALADVFFVSPLAVADGQQRDIRITVARDGLTSTFLIESRADAAVGEPPRWQEHARATIDTDDASEPAVRCLDEIRARCTVRELSFERHQQTKQERYISFGPRWRVLRRIDLGRDEALGWLVLPAQFSADLDVYKAHPALLDIAAHIGLPLIESYEQSDDFYVPFSSKRVRIWGPLPSEVYSHVRYRPGSAQRGMAVFDVCLMDASGRVLVEIDELVLKRSAATELAQARNDLEAARVQRSTGPAARRSSREGTPDLLRLGLTEGISPAEGAQVLARVLAADVGPQIVATSMDLHALMTRVQAPSRPQRGGGTGPAVTSGSEGGAGYVAPRNDVERQLAAFWQELMGLDRVGVHDDFFDVGGYSLIAVRLFARIKKAFGVDLALDTLFQASTIARCAAIIADELGIELEGTTPSQVVQPAASQSATSPTNGTGEPALLTNGIAHEAPGSTKSAHASGANGAAPVRRTPSWSPLVAIQPHGEKRPFFCVHGAGGNVLVFRDLSRRLGADQPFYGLQAQGVDGKLPPLESIEEMAAQYLRSIRQVQQRGPYLLGGYSGGGVVAFEAAQRLLSEGEEVALLAFLDTFNPGPAIRRDTSSGRLQKLLQRGPAYAASRARWWWDVHVRDGVKRARIDHHVRRGLAVPMELRDLQMYETFHRAQARYRPMVYPGRIVLFRATDIAAAFAHVGPELGWTGLAEQGIEVHEIPGNHDTLVLEPNVQILVGHLKASLEAARAGAAQTMSMQQVLVPAGSVP